MDQQSLEGKLGASIEVDICFACHVLWLDKRESLQLSPRGTLDLFRALNDHRDDPRHSIRASNGCPRCGGLLELMHDIGKGGRFSYYRCPKHGRLTPFSEFLKEKEFVRNLSPVEQQQLSAEVKQVQCSSCGAPVQLSEGFACQHCGSALTVLDADAVDRTLKELDAADAARKALSPEEAEARARAMAAMENLQHERFDPHDRGSFSISIGRSGGMSGTGADLLSASINMLFKALG
jgi:DNA-directed RNA polymerase subunit M/transcription elongation factor TFIIS